MKEHEVLKFDESGIHELEEGERERESRCCCRGHLKMVCKVQLVQRWHTWGIRKSWHNRMWHCLQLAEELHSWQSSRCSWGVGILVCPGVWTTRTPRTPHVCYSAGSWGSDTSSQSVQYRLGFHRCSRWSLVLCLGPPPSTSRASNSSSRVASCGSCNTSSWVDPNHEWWSSSSVLCWRSRCCWSAAAAAAPHPETSQILPFSCVSYWGCDRIAVQHSYDPLLS